MPSTQQSTLEAGRGGVALGDDRFGRLHLSPPLHECCEFPPSAPSENLERPVPHHFTHTLELTFCTV